MHFCYCIFLLWKGWILIRISCGQQPSTSETKSDFNKKNIFMLILNEVYFIFHVVFFGVKYSYFLINSINNIN